MPDLVTDPVGSMGAWSVTSFGVWAREGLPGRPQGHHSSLPSSCATRHPSFASQGPERGCLVTPQQTHVGGATISHVQVVNQFRKRPGYEGRVGAQGQ